ncbi:MAG TPA: helix-turn-helix domain-containing protein [Limnochordia bacterium]
MHERRRDLLRLLLHHKAGLTIDALAERLGISRNAVQQHIVALQRDGLIEEAGTQESGGRPSRLYTLSEAGYETFPRHYDTLSGQTLLALKEIAGSAALIEALERVADQIAAQAEPRLERLEGSERLAAVVEIMNEIGYEASAAADGEAISALNCVYHRLARDLPEVCLFDVALLSRLVGRPIEHVQCMAKGEHACVFKARRR